MKADWKRTCLLLLLGGPTVLWGCSGDDGGTGPDLGGDITLPLAVGNTWYYTTRVDTTSGFAAGAPDSATIASTETFDGETYFELDWEVDEDFDALYFRQAGQEVWLVPVFGEIVPGGSDLEAFLEDLAETFPWKFADFDAQAGTDWTAADVSGTVVVDVFGELDVHVTAAGSSLGRGTVQVPAGTYEDAYSGTFRLEYNATGPGFLFTSSATYTMSVAGGVGIVKIQSSAPDLLGGGTITSTSDLTGYSLN